MAANRVACPQQPCVAPESISLSRKRASASLVAVVQIMMSMPRILSILSYSISGKTNCSFMPIAKLPRPSKLFGLMPWRSRTPGSGMLKSRCRKSYMRIPRGDINADPGAFALTP